MSFPEGAGLSLVFQRERERVLIGFEPGILQRLLQGLGIALKKVERFGFFYDKVRGRPAVSGDIEFDVDPAKLRRIDADLNVLTPF